ncbi:MAG: DJ-1/PfpI family protein [Candidatus Dormibacteraeota bacterium]|nr:DJ-1/PfpI family protein [Candidatus Dormibacteraeota bacterium]
MNRGLNDIAASSGPLQTCGVRTVVVVAFPGVQVLDVTGPAEVFAIANRWLPTDRGYHLTVASPSAGILRTSGGVGLVADRSLEELVGPLDTLLVAGGEGVGATAGDSAVVSAVRHLAGDARRVASVCTGAFLLAAAGLLDGRRATTHWDSCQELARMYPKVLVEPDPIFVRDGQVSTSAGITAGIDLALELVQEDHGRALALRVARQLVVFVQRPGGQSQFSTQLATQGAERRDLRDLQAWIAEHPDADLRIEALAERVAMSTRNFSRAFRKEVGIGPGHYVERARVEAARRHLEESGQSLEQVANHVGFGSAEVLRRSFWRTLGVSPSAYRERFSPGQRTMEVDGAD